eukprot:1051407-Prorocentrum_minimum.AAC.1
MEFPLVHQLRFGGGTLLGLAAMGGKQALVRLLVANGAEVDGTGRSGMMAAVRLAPLAQAYQLERDRQLNPVTDLPPEGEPADPPEGGPGEDPAG